MQPVAVAPFLTAGSLVELSPGTSVDVELYWTVIRLSASALKAMTDAVRRVAAHSLQFA